MITKQYLLFYITFLLVLTTLLNLSLFMFPSGFNISFGAYSKAPISQLGPTVHDPNLSVEKVNDKKLNVPTSMVFLNEHEILVLEKNTGKVLRIVDGHVLPIPALDVPVASDIERGMLGIAVSENKNNNTDTEGKTYVFLYYTESGNGVDGSDTAVGGKVDPLGNRLYRYDYVDGKLINPLLLLDLPSDTPNGRAEHDGGKVRIGPDGNVYVIVGEVGGHRTLIQNNATGPSANGLGGVLRITQDGKVVTTEKPIFGKDIPLSLYYAMGIRNSFGIDFDPVTGTLWDTENGPDTGDEVNMILPGFNSGWSKIQGYAKTDLLQNGFTKADLVKIGKSKYYDPKFVWRTTIGPTALKFLNSSKLGKEYENNMFVGDINNGYLYRFTLNDKRDDIFINNTYSGDIRALADNEADKPIESQPLIFGQGFGGITDLQVGPDGYLYVLTFPGNLFKILPAAAASQQSKISMGQSTDIAGLVPTTPVLPNDTVSVIINGIKGSKSYSPNPIKITAGQTITWYNGDIISHTVTSGLDGDSDRGSLFDSKSILAGNHYSLTFADPGTYNYFCVYHPTMMGKVIVKEAPNKPDDNNQGDESKS